MKTIPPSTFPQYSNGSAPLLRKVARINGGYSLTRHNAFSWLAPRFNVTQMSLRTDSNLLLRMISPETRKGPSPSMNRTSDHRI